MAKKGKKKDSHEERLIHSSTKLLHRAVKKSKAFEVKKAIRKEFQNELSLSNSECGCYDVHYCVAKCRVCR